MKVNYITGFPLNEVSGGFSGMNAAAFRAINEKHDVTYVGPVNPKPFRSDALWSKFLKLIGVPRTFYYFSEKRLRTIAAEVSKRCNPDADFDFYHGFSPWVRCRTSRPYMSWCDCAFLDYIEIYHKGAKFSAADVRRISNAEREWFAGSKAVFLSSEWAQQRLVKTYGVHPAKVGSVGIFGAMEPPPSDSWDGSTDLYFISSDYRLKNGSLCRKAMDEVWKKFPDVRLRIVGAKPPPEDLVPGKVTYEGFFKKSDPSQLQTFRQHLANAFAILHPTDADTTAMILIEAAFFGCPSITVNDFAIPEVLGKQDGGIFLDRPLTPGAMAKAIFNLLENRETYLNMRKICRTRALERHTVEAFCGRVQRSIDWAFSLP